MYFILVLHNRLRLAYSIQQSELAREFLSFAQAQDDPIVGKCRDETKTAFLFELKN